MPENNSANTTFSWCTTFVRSLFENGIRNVVISPGSRSTPLTLAFSAHNGFKKTISIDERSAAFQALGMAKASQTPVVLICTSGTALANYAPAVTEATNAGIPLIILSADRPPYLRDTGSSQTIDQIKFFGTQPVFFHEVGEPSSNPIKLHRIKLLASQAVHNAKQHNGVAHLNFCFDKPFEPSEDFLSNTKKENEIHAHQNTTAYKQTNSATTFDEQFWSQLISAEFPLIVVGANESNNNHTFITDLATVLNAPIIAEPASNLPSSKNVISGYSGFLRNSEHRDSLKPDLILRFGSFPVSKGVQLLLSENIDILQLCFTSNNLANDGDVPAFKSIYLKHRIDIPEITGNANPSWLQSWIDISNAFKNYADKIVAPSSPLSDGFIMKTAMQTSIDDAFYMVSNSFPIRDLALYSDFSDKQIFVNRGAAGIDGIISTTIGISTELDKTGVLFIGDIAFLHDLNALLQAKLITKPLIIVLFNNGGGTIFRMLPVVKFKDEHQSYFETPQNAHIVSLCRGFGVNHELVSMANQFESAFKSCLNKPGIHVIECITDADNSMKERHKLWDFSLSSTHED